MNQPSHSFMHSFIYSSFLHHDGSLFVDGVGTIENDDAALTTSMTMTSPTTDVVVRCCAVVGAPVTCLALFPARKLCLYNQGSFLVRTHTEGRGREQSTATPIIATAAIKTEAEPDCQAVANPEAEVEANAAALPTNEHDDDDDDDDDDDYEPDEVAAERDGAEGESRLLVFPEEDPGTVDSSIPQLHSGKEHHNTQSFGSRTGAAANNLYGVRWPLPTTTGLDGNDTHEDSDEKNDDSSSEVIKDNNTNDGRDDVLVFGGRRIAWVADALRHNRPMSLLPVVVVHKTASPSASDSTVVTAVNPQQRCWVLPDWICDCRWGQRDNNNQGTVLVGLAHRQVLICRVERVFVNECSNSNGMAFMRVTIVATIPGPSAGAAFAQALAFSPVGATPTYGVQVAAGSMLQDITVWSLPDGDTLDTPPSPHEPLHHQQSLRGHTGAIHSVRFDTTGRFLVSASDDRTVRLWRMRRDDLNDDNTSDRWEEAWVAWGHAARCWSAEFVGSRSGSRRPRFVVSTSEDGTARVWDVERGGALTVLRGHAPSQSVWRVATHGYHVATGAHDGSVALHNLRRHANSVGGDCTPDLLSLPMTDNKQDCSTRQVVVAMDFYRPTHNVCHTDATPAVGLMVATQCGSVLSFDTVTREWTAWPTYRAAAQESDGSEANPTSLSVHPSGNVVAIGTSFGSVELRLVQGGRSATTQATLVLPGYHNGTVKRLEWVGTTALLVFHVQLVVLWYFQDGAAEQGELPIVVRHLQIQLDSDGIPKCAALEDSQESLVMGDTRGNVSLVPLPAAGGESQLLAALAPSSVARRAHAKEHVNHVLWKGCCRVFSAGNNGCICELSIRGGCITLMLSISLSPFTGLERLWNCQDTLQSTVVGGYYGNAFALKHFDSEYEFLRIETGGRQRNFCIRLHSGDNGAVSAAYFAVLAVKKEGGHAIQLTCHSVPDLRIRPCWGGGSVTNRQGPAYCLGLKMHTETIYDVLVHDDPTTNSKWLVTCSEDCSTRIALVRHGSIVASKLLPLQASSARAVQMCNGHSPGNKFLVVGGAKRTLQFFAVGTSTDLSKNNLLVLAIESLGSLTDAANGLQDHRINAVAAMSVPLRGPGEQGYLVASGDSNGECYLYRVSGYVRQKRFSSRLVVRFDRPILSLAITRCLHRTLLLIGTSGGHLVMQDLSGSETDLFAQLSPKIDLCRPHSVGTNAISVRTMSSDDNGTGLIRVCTGGDDQSVYCCDVALSTSPVDSWPALMSATILSSALLANACESAARGLSWMGDGHVCVTGYDQRLLVYKLDYPRLHCRAQHDILIGDVNCLSAVQNKTPCDSYLVVVAGSGLELFSIKITF